MLAGNVDAALLWNLDNHKRHESCILSKINSLVVGLNITTIYSQSYQSGGLFNVRLKSTCVCFKSYTTDPSFNVHLYAGTEKKFSEKKLTDF